MQSLFWLAAALSFIALANTLSRDEIHALALGSAGIFSGLWGLATAPSLFQVTFGLLAIGWVQVSLFRS
ncbi:MAG: hypothetical protein AAFR42_06905 [Cyanobacteria bacterium J06628_6]